MIATATAHICFFFGFVWGDVALFQTPSPTGEALPQVFRWQSQPTRSVNNEDVSNRTAFSVPSVWTV